MRVFRCTGGCGGVSATPGACQAEGCAMKGQPLEEVEQCEACAAKTAESGQPSACPNCKKV